MDWIFIVDHLILYVEAGVLTIKIAELGIIGSMLVGLLCCFIKELQIPFMKHMVQVYVELSRNTPLLIQLFFLYFGLPKLGILLSSEQCAVTGLVFLGGSYMTEAFRSGIEYVEDSQKEAAYSLGMTEKQIFFYIILPQAIATSMPIFFSNVIFLIKETHADVPKELLDKNGINGSVLRLSVGIEDVKDLISELERVFEAVRKESYDREKS